MRGISLGMCHQSRFLYVAFNPRGGLLKKISLFFSVTNVFEEAIDTEKQDSLLRRMDNSALREGGGKRFSFMTNKESGK